MVKPAENDGTWNMYRNIVEQSVELEDDIRKLHSILTSAEDLYGRIYERYEDLPDWDYLHCQLGMAVGQPEILSAVLPLE